jgi:hypothetical protein
MPDLRASRNTPGIPRTDNVLEAASIFRQPTTGVGHVIRDGRMVAVVAYSSLDGVACAGAGIAGS